MQIKTLLVDLDDTVYPADSGLWELIKHRISLYMHEKLKMDWETIPQLRSSYYKNYGTTMRGLLADYDIDKEEYLNFVHDVPLTEYITRDSELRKILLRLPQRKIIFTNADTAHAERVLEALGITDCFEKIVDIMAVYPYCKPLPVAFQIAMEHAGEKEPRRCAFLDDSITNLSAARQLGFYTVRVGSDEPSDHYDTGILRLRDICKVLPCT
jgi:putative hydrolase of the HAD superfamily